MRPRPAGETQIPTSTPIAQPNWATRMFLGSPRIKVQGARSPLDRGMLRYALNEVTEAGISPFRGRFDVYHPTYFRPTSMIRSRRIVVTHHDLSKNMCKFFISMGGPKVHGQSGQNVAPKLESVLAAAPGGSHIAKRPAIVGHRRTLAIENEFL